MRQLLQNVIGNALKFCRSEQPPVVKIRNHLISAAAWVLVGFVPADGEMRMDLRATPGGA